MQKCENRPFFFQIHFDIPAPMRSQRKNGPLQKTLIRLFLHLYAYPNSAEDILPIENDAENGQKAFEPNSKISTLIYLSSMYIIL